MPVEDHPTHEAVQIKADKPYGCHSKPRLPALVNLGPAHGLRSHFGSRDCRYDLHQSDPRCTGCTKPKDIAYLTSYGLVKA